MQCFTKSVDLAIFGVRKLVWREISPFRVKILKNIPKIIEFLWGQRPINFLGKNSHRYLPGLVCSNFFHFFSASLHQNPCFSTNFVFVTSAPVSGYLSVCPCALYSALKRHEVSSCVQILTVLSSSSLHSCHDHGSIRTHTQKLVTQPSESPSKLRIIENVLSSKLIYNTLSKM